MKLKLHWQILIAIGAAFALGLTLNGSSSAFATDVSATCKFFGTLFLNALKMVVVPLVASSIIVAVSGLGGRSNLGRLGLKTIAFYSLTSLSAILVGLLFVNTIHPGIIDGEPARHLLQLTPSAELQEKLQQVGDRDSGDIVEVFLRMVPPNIFAAATDNGAMLGLITFAILFGFLMSRIPLPGRDVLQNFWQGTLDVMMDMTMFIMKFAPIGVFALICPVVISTGLEAMRAYFWLLITVVLALAAHAFITLPIFLRVVGRLHPLRHFRAVSPALLTAFSTASSSGTLPLTMECVEKNAGVSNKTAGFVLPLGATINMDGTALYECVAAMFIAQVYGLDLSFAQQFTVVLIALLTSIGVAGIPAASLVAITVILTAIGLPPEGIGLLLVTDRILDMLRTAVNVFSDTCCAVVIAKTEGEDQVLAE